MIELHPVITLLGYSFDSQVKDGNNHSHGMQGAKKVSFTACHSG